MNACFLLLFRLVLREGVERHHEAAARSTGEDDACVHPAAAQGGEAGPKQPGHEPKAAQRDQSQLNAVAADVGGKEAAADDTDAKNAGDFREFHRAVTMPGVGVQFLGERDEDEAERVGDEPEIRHPHCSKADGPATEDNFEAFEMFQRHAFAPVNFGMCRRGLNADGGDEFNDAQDADDDQWYERRPPGIARFFIFGAIPDAAGPHAAEDAGEHRHLQPAGDAAQAA